MNNKVWIFDNRKDSFSEDYYKVYCGSMSEFLFDNFDDADKFYRSLAENSESFSKRLVHVTTSLENIYV